MHSICIDTICKATGLPKETVEVLLRDAAKKSILCPDSIDGDLWTTGIEGEKCGITGMEPAENIRLLVGGGGINKELGEFCTRVIGLMNNGGAGILCTLDDLKREYDDVFALPPREQSRAVAELLLKMAPQVVVYEGENTVDTIYKIACYGKIITLDGNEIMDPNKFNSNFFCKHGISFPPVSKSLWAKIITCWRSGVHILPSPDVSPELEAMDAIKNYIKSAVLVADIGQPRFGYVYAVDGEVYVPSQVIQQVLSNANSKVTMRRLHYVMSDYVLDKAVLKKVPVARGGGLYRFWRFDPASVDVDMSRAVRLEEEEVAEKHETEADKTIREAFVKLGAKEVSLNDLAAALEDLGVGDTNVVIERAVENAVIVRMQGGGLRIV